RFKKSHSRFNQTDESLLDVQEPDLEGKCLRCESENSDENWCGSCTKDIGISQLPDDLFGHLIRPKNMKDKSEKLKDDEVENNLFNIVTLSWPLSRGVKSFIEYIPKERFQNIKPKYV
ncbi:12811_t:CDS:1, partial [Racocetra persica]